MQNFSYLFICKTKIFIEINICYRIYFKIIQSCKNTLFCYTQTDVYKRQRILRDANEEAHRILREAKEYADQTMKIFNKAGKESMSAKELEQKRSELRKKMDTTGKKMALKTPEKKKSTLTAKDISQMCIRDSC